MKEYRLSRRSALKSAGLMGTAAILGSSGPVETALMASESAISEKKDDFNAYPEHILKYLRRLYDPSKQPLAFRDDYPGGFQTWHHEARSALQRNWRWMRLRLRSATIGQSLNLARWPTWVSTLGSQR
jgi:hypothetical protein